MKIYPLKPISFIVISLTIIWLLFFIKGFIALDPDFGWHIRMGQIILDSGIPTKDPFSYTMPSFPFVDHEWLTNIILFKLYKAVGYTGLSILFAGLTLLALVIVIPRGFLKFAMGPLLLSGVILLPFSGIRPQVITWLMLSLLFNFLLNLNLWKKLRFFIPIFFILWANLHGGFAIGLLVLLFFIVSRIWIERSINIINLAVGLLSIGATLINPYGINLWGEVWMQISDSSLRFTIVEWLPIIFRFDFGYLLFATICSFLIFKFNSKFSLSEILIYGLLLLMGLSSQRHIPLWVIISLPLSIKAIYFLSEEVKKLKKGKERFNKVYKGFILIAFLIFVGQSVFILTSINRISEENFYPKEAVNFLSEHKFQGQLFAPYDWGGYLIWKLPEKKVFVDGRMPSWRYVGPSQESSYAYRDYLNIINNKSKFTEAALKYNVHEVLWFNLKPVERNKYLNFILQVPLFNKMFNEGESKNLIKRLEKEGWKKVYEDKVSVIYQKA